MANPCEIRIVFNRFPILGAQALAAADKVCNQTAHAIEGDAKILMATSPKTGRIYMKGKHGDIAHQASAPGEPPAMDTSNLINSGFAERRAEADWEAGFSAEYALPLEFGTPKVAPRPFLRPTVEQRREGFIDMMTKAVEGL